MFEVLKGYKKKLILAIGLGLIVYSIKKSKKVKRISNKEESSLDLVKEENKKVVNYNK